MTVNLNHLVNEFVRKRVFDDRADRKNNIHTSVCVSQDAIV